LEGILLCHFECEGARSWKKTCFHGSVCVVEKMALASFFFAGAVSSMAIWQGYGRSWFLSSSMVVWQGCG
jgi:hypothetical protein